MKLVKGRSHSNDNTICKKANTNVYNHKGGGKEEEEVVVQETEVKKVEQASSVVVVEDNFFMSLGSTQDIKKDK